MLLSMEVIDNKVRNNVPTILFTVRTTRAIKHEPFTLSQIIAGSKDKRLQSWQMSGQVRALL